MPWIQIAVSSGKLQQNDKFKISKPGEYELNQLQNKFLT